MYEIYVRNQNLERVAQVTDYQKLEIVQRFNEAGTWVLNGLPSDSPATEELLNQQAGIVVKRNDVTLFSGYVSRKNRHWNSDSDTVTVSGYDDTAILSHRLAYPVPAGPPYSSSDYDVRTGLAEAVMKQYVEVNIGTNASSERTVRGLAVELDRGLGGSVTGRARFHTLHELLKSLALAGGGLGYRILQVGSGLEFQVYQPTDKTSEVVFSPLLGNLLDFEYELINPEFNYVIAGGGGEGVNRKFVEEGNNGSISDFGRFESFKDQRNTTDTGELRQSLEEALSEGAEQTSLSISPIDTENIAFGKDYMLGDKISVVLTQGNEKLETIREVVREVKITVTQDGERISPVVGTSESLAHPVLGIYDKMKKLGKRLSNLERR